VLSTVPYIKLSWNHSGRKVPEIIQNCASCVGLIIASFYLNPELAAILLCCLPLIGTATAIVMKVMSVSTLEGQAQYAKAGAVANEVFAGVRTVASLCSEPWEIKRYTQYLLSAEKAGIKNGLQNGLGQGIMFASFFLAYALAFWYGIKQVADDLASGCDTKCATGGKVISAIFGIIIASSLLGQMSPALTALQLARTSAVSVYETIDRVPVIDSASDTGLKPSSAQGELHIDNIGFSYPARQDDAVYTNVDI
jgi:ABC-type multidrug transport system fused ATPase/permease subunit